MKFSPKGIPILTMQKKLDALVYCIQHQAYEDAAGHLCDLLAYCGDKIEPSSGPKFETLQQLVAYYGANPTPIEEDA